MVYETIVLDVENDRAWVTISREKALNALNRQVLEELDHAIANLPKAVRVLVITGSGEKAFVAGADIKSMADFSPEGAMAFARFGQEVFSRLASIPQVVIAAVNGFALGGGCELAMACDILIATENAKFGQPEVNLGIIPGFGGTQRLARLVGRNRAMAMILTGKVISASEAKAIGLVNEVVPQGKLKASVNQVATAILEKGPLAVATAKRVIHRGLQVDLESGCELEANAFGVLFSAKEKDEGIAAFLEKRNPVFG